MDDETKLQIVESVLDGPLDVNGYPTEQTEKVVREWKGSPKGLLAYVKKVWKYAEMDFWREEDATCDITDEPIRRYFVSTAGWSGNEGLISAMRENYIFWTMNWVQSRRGGHYIFEIKEANENE